MALRDFLVLSSMLFASLAYSASTNISFEDVDQLRAEIKSNAQIHLIDHYGEKRFSQDIRLQVNPLDPRLRLRKCEQAHDFEFAQPAHRARNLTVKVVCNSTRRWTIYVPITVEVYGNVVVASRNIRRGAILHEEDIQVRRMNTTSLPLGHVEDASRILGMELRRATRKGSYLLLSTVSPAEVVKKGEAVTMEANFSSLTVATKGTAMTNGKLGEKIKVRNNRSKRLVDAQVVGPGRVSVVSR